MTMTVCYNGKGFHACTWKFHINTFVMKMIESCKEVYGGSLVCVVYL